MQKRSALWIFFVYDYRIGDVNQSISNASRLKKIGHLETVINRMIKEHFNAKDLSQCGRAYVAVKMQELFLSYLTTVRLIEPDKAKGRKAAQKMMSLLQKEFPEAAAMTEKKYQIFCLMNRMHISKQTWDAFLKSKLYKVLRGNRDFA